MTQFEQFAPEPGKPMRLASNLTLLLAPNPSPMTFLGTNTYILGGTSVAVIDPGPDNDAHITALMRAIDGRTVSHILLTHSHLDHSPLARPLAAVCGAKIYAFGDSFAGRSKVMTALAAEGLTGGGEGIDLEFRPDFRVSDQELIVGDDWELEAIHTPGHIGNHLCFKWRDSIFTGDHVMGWASSLVSPPDGDLTDFMRSCSKLLAYDSKIFYPGHGAPVHSPRERLLWLINHRRAREKQILAALGEKQKAIPELTRTIYAETPPALYPAAERNVFAHLIDLYERGLVQAHPALGISANYRRATKKSS